MKRDLDELRALARMGDHVTLRTSTLRALVAVVDAARVLRGKLEDWESTPELDAALEPFTPPAGRAWEEVDRWHAERDLAVKAAVDAAKPEWVRAYAATRENDAALTFAERAKLMDATLADARQNPRDRARDQLADAGVAVQRQFRSDQERIAELETKVAEALKERDWARGLVEYQGSERAWVKP